MHTRPRSEPEPWTRRRLLALLIGVALAVVLLLAGLGLAVYRTVTADGSAGHGTQTRHRTQSATDNLANRPWPTAHPLAWQPGPLSTRRLEVLVLPSPRRLGAAAVATGFPTTSQGALAQLIAIDQAALQSASVPAAQAVIDAWAVPGGPTPETWSGTRAVADLLQAAGLPMSGSPALVVSASPELGLVRQPIGRRYVVACVDFVVTATLTQTARVAAADCQRMQWSGDRWMIGPGPEPPQPPSVWPGTDAASKVGYQRLRYE